MNKLISLFVVIGFAGSNHVMAESDRISKLKEEIILLEKLVALKRELASLEKASSATAQIQSFAPVQRVVPQNQLDLKVVAQEIDAPEKKEKVVKNEESRSNNYSVKGKKTGLYAGGNIGLGFVDFNFSSTGSSDGTATADLALLAGESYGIHGGYSVPTSNGMFYAVEAEYSNSNIGISGSTNDGGDLKIELDDWKAVSFRLGKSFDNSPFVGYLKAGYADSDFTIKYTDVTSSANNVDSSANKSGWLYGAGFEHPLSKNMILRGEYLVIDLDEWSETSGLGTATLDPDVHVAKIGIDVPF